LSRHSVLDVGEHDLEDLRRRLRDTRWAEPWPVQAWEAGTDQAELRRLVDVWLDGFDWRAQQQQIEELPWHRADIDGTPVAYLRFDAEQGGTGIPVVLTNGWPSTARNSWTSLDAWRRRRVSGAILPTPPP